MNSQKHFAALLSLCLIVFVIAVPENSQLFDNVAQEGAMFDENDLPLDVEEYSADTYLHDPYYIFTYEDGGLVITGLKESIEYANIPSESGGFQVVRIKQDAFKYANFLSTVVIPSTIKTIDEGAFSSSFALKDINVSPDNKIYASVDGVLFSKDKTKLFRYPPHKYNTSYEIPASVAQIREGAFNGSAYLENITVNSVNAKLKSIDGVLFSSDGTKLLKYPEARTNTSYIVPSGVLTIGHRSFENNFYLSNITLPDSVSLIGEYAFYGCANLGSDSERGEFKFPFSLTEISENAFVGCLSIRGVIFGQNLKKIGDYAFFGCSNLISAEIPPSVNFIGKNAFFSKNKSVFDFTIYCTENSYAQSYAKDFQIGYSFNGFWLPKLDEIPKEGNVTVNEEVYY